MKCYLGMSLVFVLLSGFANTERTTAETPMNLLVIQTDEHNFRTLGCYRDLMTPDQAFVWGPQAVVETPAIDSIARRGVVCTSFYATSPVCTPSRAAFFTGRYPQNTGAPQNDLPMRSDLATFASVLKQAGYATGYAGKWHLDGPGKPQWAPERQFGFTDNRFMFNRGHWKKFEIVDGNPRVASTKQGQPTYAVAGADETSFSTDWLTDRAIEFIREHHDRPFCYHLSLPDPHGPNAVRPPYDSMFENLPIRPPMTFAKADQNPNWAGQGSSNAAKKFNAESMATYFGMVKCIDDNVAQLLAELDAQKMLERTAIVFTSDHGDLCYEHGRLNKGNPYEGSAKVPFVICAPGKLPAAAVVNEALGTVDFLPTVLSLLDCKHPEQTEGRDALAVLRGESETWDDITVLRNGGTRYAWVAAITDRYKFVLSANDEPWLFDLESDPDELINAYSLKENDSIVRDLAKHLVRYNEKFKDPFFESPKLAEQIEQVLSDENL